MNKKFFISDLLVVFTLIVILVPLAATTSAYAFWGGGRSKCKAASMSGQQGLGPGGDGWGSRLGRYLDLSTKQQQQMHDLRFAFQKKTIDLRDQIGKKRLEQKALLEAETVDWKKVDALTDEIAKLRASIEKERMRQRVEMRKILTPEQLKKLESLPYWQGGGHWGWEEDDFPAQGWPGCGLGNGPAGQGPGRGRGL
ncbi:MAG: Spy/CpxP family protein refolding chaperone [bacterium]|nr:Spy/CpxP family protein refolding chaperone [bacterium]